MGSIDCKAILFDLDGTLVDSFPMVERVLRGWAAEKGVDPEAVLAASHGRRDVDVIAIVAPDLDAPSEAAAIAEREARESHGLKEIPGALHLVESLPAHRWGVVTSGMRIVATARLEGAGFPLPRTLVTADDIREGKPHPAPFLAAAADLGFSPSDCLVFEDAPAGVRAAQAAGMDCIGIGPEVHTLVGSGMTAAVPDLAGVKVASGEGLTVTWTD
ncbi:HAD-IA family hydrolase [Salininema proteolyticum]|uniref:HAD-IA family hydrolase n=1 Tax=Salininema proteolyticum TaxID=1607685 RepID=A0ABV8TWP2_9ACTN